MNSTSTVGFSMIDTVVAQGMSFFRPSHFGDYSLKVAILLDCSTLAVTRGPGIPLYDHVGNTLSDGAVELDSETKTTLPKTVAVQSQSISQRPTIQQ